MNNKWLKLIIVVAIGLLAYLGTQYLNRPQVVVGEKAITLIITFDTEPQQFVVQTDAMTLGELLEELHTNNVFTVTFSGSPNDTFGRGLQGLNNLVTPQMSLGPQWWGWTSENNPQCVRDGFCSGVDFQTIEDGDIFVFTFSGSE